MNYILVIPARYQSTRFPGKPLANLRGVPLIEHVWRRCCQAVDASAVVIATDDDRIVEVATAFGANVEMTSPECPTGTDRVAEVASRVPAEWYLNVQGDEPFVEPAAIRTVINATENAASDVAAINAMSAISNESDFRSVTVPKPVTDSSGRLLYMSRAAIPTDKHLNFHSAFRQVGLYAFSPSALSHYSPVAMKSTLESLEDIEILRLVEAGLRVQMVKVPAAGVAVDTPEDLAKAETIFSSPTVDSAIKRTG